MRLDRVWRSVIIGWMMGLFLLGQGNAQAAAAPKEDLAVRGVAGILGDVDTGYLMYDLNVDQRIAPASLTKIMTLYLIYEALAKGDLKLDQNVPVSENAWRMSGSKTFVKVGDQVKVEDLIQGIAVQSGNDACVVLAEHLGGSEKGFADMMNNKARQLGMTGSHFVNATGLPESDHLVTTRDLFILASALIRNFPQFGHFVREKQYTFNGITQHNRNRLLWRDPSITGMKTGFTNDAGYCLIASSEKDNQRLVAVVMGAKNARIREEDALRLIRYGQRVFETVRMYEAGAVVRSFKVWKGETDKVDGVVKDPFVVTVTRKDRPNLEVGLSYTEPMVAPIAAGGELGTLVAKVGEKEVLRRPMVAGKEVPEGGFFTRIIDSIRLRFGF
ncbi:MAG: D-alanyl-D-alanine carboxypeptidase [Magnetococcales bacterium]|nr:D-alanyl-D-alanine carboxypeptidase [Magnetococcales bacterium]